MSKFGKDHAEKMMRERIATVSDREVRNQLLINFNWLTEVLRKLEVNGPA